MGTLLGRTPSETDRGWSKARLRDALATVRQRTTTLIQAMSDEQLYGQPGPEMGVPAWDVGHIGAFEEVWLVQNITEGGRDLSALGEAFDPLAHPRSHRGEMELPDRQALLGYLNRVRKQALDVLDGLDLEVEDPMVAGGFVHDMIVRHEQQHQENMLITLQMMGPGPAGPGPYRPPLRADKPPAVERPQGLVEVPAGPFTLGTDQRLGRYDNEQPAHQLELDTFWIDAAPVTNADYLAFIEDGGYDEQTHWSTDGWLIREALDWQAPRAWEPAGDGWRVREYDRVRELAPDQPVVHVSYYEAEAYAAWAGKRLPTEAEWEKAATWDPETGEKRTFPWGQHGWTPDRANLGQRLFGPAPVGAYPAGVSAVGCHQMCGDVWEWTSSIFSGYPGFQAFPYPEYSEIHFDAGYQVLRGGSWATWADCATGTFRNWHQGDHRQLFAGFRCVTEEAPA